MLHFLSLSDDRIRELPPRYVIIPIPYEKTVSYGKGTQNGPKAIILASIQLEDYDEEVDTEICNMKGIETISPLDIDNEEGEGAIQKINLATSEVLTRGLVPILIGGEHSISLGSVGALKEKYPELHIIHVDAHADLRESYEGSQYSHASVMKRIFDLGVHIHSVGIRALSKEEAALIRKNNIHVLFDYQRRHEDNWVSPFLDKIPANVPIYLTIDVDGLNPSIMPHTGTPVPGGLGWNEILELCRELTQRFQLVGFDVVEFAPQKNNHAPAFLLAQLIYKIISYNEASEALQ